VALPGTGLVPTWSGPEAPVGTSPAPARPGTGLVLAWGPVPGRSRTLKAPTRPNPSHDWYRPGVRLAPARPRRQAGLRWCVPQARTRPCPQMVQATDWNQAGRGTKPSSVSPASLSSIMGGAQGQPRQGPPQRPGPLLSESASQRSHTKKGQAWLCGSPIAESATARDAGGCGNL